MPDAPFDFSGKHVLVTGASHGIGFAVARGFAMAGATLSIVSSTDDIHAAGDRIAAEAGRAVGAHVCDIAERAMVREVIGGLAPLDVLVNNAGLERLTPIGEPGDAVEETFERIIQINVVGTYYVTREALPRLTPGASIILTSSVWGRSAAAGFSAYVTSKHANIGFMRTLARELGPDGIRVNAVCPGWVETRAAVASLERVAQRDGASTDDALADILSAQALPGLMAPDDVVGLYLFLASGHAASITGQAYNVDRGELMA